MIPFADPRAGYLAHKPEIDQAIAGVLESGKYILGPNVVAFEEEFARYIGVRHVVGVGSGTEALHIALRACGVGEGDEVITVAHTAVATIAAIELASARPVFVDIEPRFFCIDPALIEAAIRPRTKAIVPVHLYGQPVDMGAVLEIAKRHGLRVIEDCAQAHGARHDGRRVGSMGDIGAFSFYPTKNLGAFGDGGAVVTDDPELADRARLLREYGWQQRNDSQVPGWNSRLDELQAAILRVRLAHLDADNSARRHLARLYRELLGDSTLLMPAERPGTEHVYHLFVVRSAQRELMRTRLNERGIGAAVHYPVPVHKQVAYAPRFGGSVLRVTEQVAREVLSLPMYPELGTSNVRKVVEQIHASALDSAFA